MEIRLCPRYVLNRLPVPPDRLDHLDVLLSAAFVLLAAPFLSYIPHVCLAQWLLRIPCPGCGITHSLFALAHLDFRQAWHWNPAGIALAIFLALQLLARSFALLKPAVGAAVARASRVTERFVLGSLLIVWFTRLIHV